MNWNDYDEIAMALYDANPDVDPLSLRFAELYQMIINLPDFDGNSTRPREGILEQIQMAWLDEYQG
jgi:FeS assembly protein IscX